MLPCCRQRAKEHPHSPAGFRSELPPPQNTIRHDVGSTPSHRDPRRTKHLLHGPPILFHAPWTNDETSGKWSADLRGGGEERAVRVNHGPCRLCGQQRLDTAKGEFRGSRSGFCEPFHETGFFPSATRQDTIKSRNFCRTNGGACGPGCTGQCRTHLRQFLRKSHIAIADFRARNMNKRYRFICIYFL